MSKEKLLLVGAGGFGRMVAEQAMFRYDCAFMDDGQPVGAEICGIPVVGGLADLPELRKEYGIAVHPIVTVRDIIQFLYERPIDGKVYIDHAMKERMEAYLRQYGAE